MSIHGLGILIYSPFAASHISKGEDYLSTNYLDAADVQRHVQEGTIVGFGTGSSGDFILDIEMGYPSDRKLNSSEFSLRLGVEVRDHLVCFRDLYDLLEWDPVCPQCQAIAIVNGYYHITLCTSLPSSGLLGDNQKISVYLEKLDRLPDLANQGVPTLCW